MKSRYGFVYFSGENEALVTAGGEGEGEGDSRGYAVCCTILSYPLDTWRGRSSWMEVKKPEDVLRTMLRE